MNEPKVKPIQEKTFLDSAKAFAPHQKPQVIERYIDSMGQWVYLRKPTAAMRGALEAHVIEAGRGEAAKTMKMDICIITLCDADGRFIFPDAEKAYQILGPCDADIIEDIYAEAQHLVRISREDVEEEKKE